MPVHRGLIQHFRPALPLGLIERGGRGQGSGRLRVATFTGDPSCKRSLAFLRGSCAWKLRTRMKRWAGRSWGAGSARQVPRAIGGMLWGLPLISALAHRR
jgi:hypothetical protein